jgi:hypothetical protein
LKSIAQNGEIDVIRLEVTNKALSHGELALSLGRKGVQLLRRIKGAADDVAAKAVTDKNEEAAGPQCADDNISKPAHVGLALLVIVGKINERHLGRRRFSYGGKVDHA